MDTVVQRQSEQRMLSAEPRPSARRLAVWGDPIAHSLSPAMHAAAYAVLSLDWDYGREQVAEHEFDKTLARLDGTWRGLSVTMPLKERAWAASVRRSRTAELTRAVNTLLFTEAGPVGINTDVAGLAAALREAGFGGVDAVRVLGGGRTAASAIVSLGELGAHHVTVHARRPEAVADFVALGEATGVSVTIAPLHADAFDDAADLVLSTLPGGTALADEVVAAAASTPLFDVAYNPWPSVLGEQWREAGGAITSGAGMLAQQALRQIRFFVSGDDTHPLPDEATVLAAMRQAATGPAH